MSRSINKVMLIGNVGRDPEIRYLPNGNAVANFSVATSESWNDKQSGERVEKTEWHKVSCFGRLAEIVGAYVRKGSKLYIEGSLRTREWEKDGEKRYSTEINARELVMLDGRAPSESAGSDDAPKARVQSPGQKERAATSMPEDDFEDSEIPF